MLVPNKMQHVICTGNIGREQFNELCTLAPNVHVVQGDFDDDETLPFPEVQVVQVGQFRIGLIHGHQLLPSPSSQDAKARMRRKLNVDIFISGHTHQNEVVLEDGYYHINPVSLFNYLFTLFYFFIILLSLLTNNITYSNSL
ncbi:MAG: vacuolar protein sorting-associated protein 29 [Bacillariaceae sp.]|jgi:vacuolar protein sorting-associated protein 29